MSETIITGLQEGSDYTWNSTEGKLTLLSDAARNAADSAWADQAWPFQSGTYLPHLDDKASNVNEELFADPTNLDYLFLHLILQVYSTKE